MYGCTLRGPMRILRELWTIQTPAIVFFLCLKFNSLRQWTSHDFSIRIRSAIPMASACLELRIECHMFEIPNQFLIYSKIMVAIKVTYAYCFGVLSMLNISKLIYLLKTPNIKMQNLQFFKHSPKGMYLCMYS